MIENVGAKKEKTINFGITEELKNFLNEWTETTMQEAKDLNGERKEYSKEIKVAIVEIAMRELGKIDKQLSEIDDNQEWFRLMEKVDKISDVVRWF